MLFANSHSVEELVDIKKQKKVDKVLLKVIRTVRSRGNITDWVKPESDFKADLKLSDKVILGIKKALGDYYNLDLMSNSSLNSAKAIVSYIKTNKPNVADSIYLVDIGEQEVDTDNEVQMDSNATMVPQGEPIEPMHTEVPEEPIPHQEVMPDNAPILDNPTNELKPEPEIIKESTTDTPETKEQEIANEPNVQPATETPVASTEGLAIKPEASKSWADVMNNL